MKISARVTSIAALAVMIVLTMAQVVHARPVTPQEAQTAVDNWLSAGVSPLGAKVANLRVKGVTSVKDDDGQALYHCAEIEGGFVITSADTELTPILAFSGSGSLEKFKGSPFEALLTTDQREKLSCLARGAAAKAVAARTRLSSSAKGAVDSDASTAWADLLSGALTYKSRQSSVSDRRVDKLLETEWGQSTWDGTRTKVFNYYTPNNYVCGCAATALAQVMKYHEAPQGSIASFSRECEVDGVAVTKTSRSGAFDWSNMPLTSSLTPSPSETQAQAIGKLTYNAGVALSMSWTSGGSGAYANAIYSALNDAFDYASVSFGSCVVGSGTLLGGDIENAIYGSLDAHMPVILAILGTPGGHAIVADGYGYSSGTRYTHLNMGWSGLDDMWYNLMGDAIYTEACGSFTYLKGVGFNIHPTATGQVISGQVKTQAGSVSSGATVKLLDTAGSEIAHTTTDSHGIYSFRVTSAGTYRIRAESGGLTSIDATTVISSSTVNSWGNNLTLAAPEGLPDLCFMAPDTTWPAAVCLSAGDSAARDTSFLTTDTIKLFVGMGNAGSVTVPSVYKVTHEVLSGSTVVASWVYEANTWDLMDPGIVSYWSGYAWSGINNLQPGSYTYRCALDSYGSVAESDESNNVTTYAFTVVGGSSISLPVALDNADLTFTTGGAAPWYGQSLVYYQNGSAAQSGTTGNSETSWMQTSVSGPCTVSFMWKVSSELNWDKLKFYVDGSCVTNISGEVSWTRVSYALASGSHTLKWAYEKDGSASSGNDSGWVDAVSVSQTSTDVTVTFDPNGGTCETSSRTYTAGQSYGWLPRPVKSGCLFMGWRDASVDTTCPATDHTLVALWETSSITLSEALTAEDSETLSFTTGGDASWLAQKRFAYDGSAAAYSGVIGANESSWVETVVTGPGQISFMWAAGSEANYDWLTFTIDGVEQGKISHVNVWTEFVTNITSGAHTLRWQYSKDGSVNRDWDCGYLDNVCWTPSESTDVTVTFHGCGGTVSEETHTYNLGTSDNPRTYGYLPSATRVSYRFEGWYTSDSGGRLVTEDQDVDASVTDLYAHWAYQTPMDIGVAVNASDLTFTTGGDASWFGQSADSQDGDGAAQSGLITHGQSSWMQTTLVGSGTLAFWWKTSSESGWDKLKLYVDGTFVTEFSGTTGWEYYTYGISGEGEHTVKWMYSKDSSVSVGEDCARVDAISFGGTPTGEKNGYGILVGVNEYDPNYVGAYNWLNCCVVDVNNIKSTMLLDKCGWDASNINTMLNADATKADVIGAMQTLAAQVQPGDRVLYYQSSHGGQYYGTSTFLCMFDQDFSDTDFAEAISVFPSGVKLLIVIDACHSGGMFKSYGTSLSTADVQKFIAGVTTRLNEIRMEEHALGVKGTPKIGSGEIAWTTASNYDEYSWGGSGGSSFTVTYCDAIRNGSADLTTGSIAVGNGDGKIDALEVAKYAHEYWKDENIQGYTMTPQYHNETPLAAFYWVGSSGGDVTPSDDKPNLRWIAPNGWSSSVFLSATQDESDLTACRAFEIDAPVYMKGAFQNAGAAATEAPFVILHELMDANGNVIDSWTYEYSSLMAAAPDSYTYWSGAYWGGLNGLAAGNYTYRCTLDTDGTITESDESDNVVTYSFRVNAAGDVTITFYGNGGTPEMTTCDYTPGQSYGSFPSVNRDGYAFVGWQTEDGTDVTVDSRVPSVATSLYAQWSATDLPNLSVSWIGETSRTFDAESIQSVILYFTVNNTGAGVAAPSRAAIRMAYDGGASTIIGYVAADELVASGYQDCTYEIAASELSGKSVMSVTVEADADNDIDEVDESDNVSSPYSISIAADAPNWTTDQPQGDSQSVPMIFQRMLVKMADGANAQLGDIVGIFRSDTGALCGRGEVTVDGTVTVFVRVASGVSLDFKVWDESASIAYEAAADTSYVTNPGDIVTDAVIRARGADEGAEWSMTLSLPQADWHLVSVNALPDDPSPSSVFSAAGTGIDYVIGDEWWSPVYGGEMRAVEIGKGYWVHTTVNNLAFPISGRGAPTIAMSLAAGWNLLGYNLRYAHDASDALATAVAENKIQFVCTTGDVAIFPYSPLTMEPGKGYWFYAPQACTIVYDQVDGDKSVVVAPSDSAKDNLPQNPWTGVAIETARVQPTVIQAMSVMVSGQLAQKGDVVAVVDGTGKLYSVGSVDASGNITLVLSVEAGTTLMFRYWKAGGSLDAPVILSDTHYSTGFVVTEPGAILTGMSTTFTEEDPTVTISLDYNGASRGSNPAELTLEPGSVYGLRLPSPTRSGYTFLGWFTEVRSGTQVTAASIVPSYNATLYAHWSEVKTYSVKVRDTHGGAAASVERAEAGDAVSLTAPSAYVKNGKRYVFQKWMPSKSLDLGANFNPGDCSTTVSMPAQNLTVSAVYLKESRVAHLTVTCQASRQQFNGWYVDPDVSKLQWSTDGLSWYASGASAIVPSGSVTVRWRTLLDVWQPNVAKTRVSLVPGEERSLTGYYSFASIAQVETAVYEDGRIVLDAEGGTAKTTPANGRLVDGKTIAFSATLKSGYAFVGWVMKNDIGVSGLPTLEQSRASFSQDGLNTWNYTDHTDFKVHYVAVFRSLSDYSFSSGDLEDFFTGDFNVEGVDASSEDNDLFVNAVVGCDVQVDLISGVQVERYPVTFRLSGSLPKGLKLDASTGMISGAPTAVGMSSCRVAVTDPLGYTMELPLSFYVAPLADAVVGNFRANLYEYGGWNADRHEYVLGQEPIGAVEVSVSSVGKLSAKVTLAAESYSFVPTLNWNGGDSYELVYEKRTVKGSTGSEVCFLLNPSDMSVSFSVSKWTAYDESFIDGYGKAGRCDLNASTIRQLLNTYYTVALEASLPEQRNYAYRQPTDLVAGGYVTLTIDAKGGVKYSGALPDGEKISGSTYLLADETNNCARACLFAVPSGYKKQGCFAIDLALSRSGTVTDNRGGWIVPPLVDCPTDLEETSEDEQLMSPGLLSLAANGAVYQTLNDLQNYYLSLEVEPASAPMLEYNYTQDGEKIIDYAEAVSSFGYLGSVALTGAYGGKVTVSKSEKPILGSDGAYDYLSVENPAGLSMAFKPATGIFSGKFNLFFDYTTSKGDAETLNHKAVSVPYAGVVVNGTDGPYGLGSAQYSGKFTFGYNNRKGKYATKSYTQKTALSVFWTLED